MIWAGTGGCRGCWWRWCCRRDGTLRTVQTALSRPIYILALHPASRGTTLPSSRYLRLAPSLLASFFLALPLSRWSQTPLIIVIGPFLETLPHTVRSLPYRFLLAPSFFNIIFFILLVGSFPHGSCCPSFSFLTYPPSLPRTHSRTSK